MSDLSSLASCRGQQRSAATFCRYRKEMSRSLLNIAKRPLPRLTLRGVGLTSKDAVS
jgi:hypothetical protein